MVQRTSSFIVASIGSIPLASRIWRTVSLFSAALIDLTSDWFIQIRTDTSPFANDGFDASRRSKIIRYAAVLRPFDLDGNGKHQGRQVPSLTPLILVGSWSEVLAECGRRGGFG